MPDQQIISFKLNEEITSLRQLPVSHIGCHKDGISGSTQSSWPHFYGKRAACTWKSSIVCTVQGPEQRLIKRKAASWGETVAQRRGWQTTQILLVFEFSSIERSSAILPFRKSSLNISAAWTALRSGTSSSSSSSSSFSWIFFYLKFIRISTTMASLHRPILFISKWKWQ